MNSTPRTPLAYGFRESQEGRAYSDLRGNAWTATRAFMTTSKRATRFLWTAVTFLVVIGIAAVTRRTLVLFWPGTVGEKASPAAALDLGFARHMALTLIHILAGGLFLVLAPLQFMASIRQKHLQLHRWMGRVLVLCGLRSLSAGHELHDEHWRTQ